MDNRHESNALLDVVCGDDAGVNAGAIAYLFAAPRLFTIIDPAAQ